MASGCCVAPFRPSPRLFAIHSSKNLYHTTRAQKSVGALPTIGVDPVGPVTSESTKPTTPQISALARLPTSSILRSLFLGSFFTSPLLFKPSFAVFQALANSKSTFLNPDTNPVLRALICPLVYQQFCAGRNPEEIVKTSDTIRNIGFSGVILSYAKEVQVSADKQFLGYDESKNAHMEEEIRIWREGNLLTLDMMREGDWLAIKMSGAGLGITNALMNNEEPPASFMEAMDAMCVKANERKCQIWIDSEQSAIQKSIDKWTIDLMRKHNNNGYALIYNTVQAYLKCSREKVQHQLSLSVAEGWKTGIKLVRGAYMSNDVRENIHDTKRETDVSYDGIVRDLLHYNFPVLKENPNYTFGLVCAGHNSNSIRKATEIAKDLASKSQLKVSPKFAQLQGMADEVGCEILQAAENARIAGKGNNEPVFAPKVYKYLTWGSIQECMQYLARRIVENRDAADRMKEGMSMLRKELWRRTWARQT